MLSAFRVVLTELQGGSVPDPDSLVHLTRRAPGAHMTSLTYPELAFYAASAKSFRSVIGVSERNQAVFSEAAAGSTAESIPESIDVAFVTSNYFPEFGIAPALGRVLTPDDERPDAEPAAVIGGLFWQRRLGGDPAVIGRSIRVNGKRLRVVGVMPRSARIRDDVWMPLVRQPYVVEGSTLLTDWHSALDVHGRLRPGVSPQASQQETLALAGSLRGRRPDHVWKGEYLEARPIHEFDRNSDEFTMVLTAAALMLLLLVAACANLGTLVLARGVTREREIRVRMALGAGRLRIVRQLFTESLLLAVLSGLGALLLSTVVLRVMQLQLNSTAGLIPDWRALAATFGAAMPEPLEFHLPRSRSDAPESVLLVRVSGAPRNVVRRLQDTARGLDERLQPTVQVVADAYDREVASASGALAAIAMLGTVAILLSVIGLAGLAGYTVAQRTREIGLRIALGARPSHVVRAILAPMSRPIVIGFVCGALGGSAVASVLRSGTPTMSGINVLDPLPYTMAMALFAAVVALSILAPGRRATRINPIQALQHE